MGGRSARTHTSSPTSRIPTSTPSAHKVSLWDTCACGGAHRQSNLAPPPTPQELRSRRGGCAHRQSNLAPPPLPPLPPLPSLSPLPPPLCVSSPTPDPGPPQAVHHVLQDRHLPALRAVTAGRQPPVRRDPGLDARTWMGVRTHAWVYGFMHACTDPCTEWGRRRNPWSNRFVPPAGTSPRDKASPSSTAPLSPALVLSLASVASACAPLGFVWSSLGCSKYDLRLTHAGNAAACAPHNPTRAHRYDEARGTVHLDVMGKEYVFRATGGGTAAGGGGSGGGGGGGGEGHSREETLEWFVALAHGCGLP